jgi:RNA polymerase sigma factor (sigma-70 family)
VADLSEEAFTELTRRHMGLVYSAALRQVRDQEWAKDITQLVFAHLARQARFIAEGTILAGWLHRDTRYTALDFIRAEARRCRREQHFIEMNAPAPDPQAKWEEIRPWLDEAMTKLAPADRDALLLRYFEQRDFAGVGAALGASAEAARKKVDRALARLRVLLGKRGITTTAAALGGALMAHAIETVPEGFVVSLAAASAAGGSGWISNLIFMTKTKITIGAALVAGILATSLMIQQHDLAAARAEQLELQARLHPIAAPAGQAIRQARDTFDAVARDRADLERLRREATALGTKMADFSAQAQRLVAASPAHRPGSIPLGQVLRFQDLRDAGQTTPEAAIQTFMWAMLQGDTNRMAQLLDINPGPNGQPIQGTLEMLWAGLANESSQMRSDAEAEGMASIMMQIVEKQPGQNEDQYIVVEMIEPNNAVFTRRILLHPTETGWKCAVGANGGPVEEDTTGQP